MALDGKLKFALAGSSLIDLIEQRIPNYSRTSSILIEKEIDNGIILHAIGRNFPAINEVDGSIELHPGGINLFTNNMDLDHPVWVKGSSVKIDRDRSLAPSRDNYQAEKVTWTGGPKDTRSIKRSLSLYAEKWYTCWGYLQLDGSARCGPLDVIRFTGDVVGFPQFRLIELNQYPGKYRLFEFSFKTAGREPPESFYNANQAIALFNVSAVNGGTVTLDATNVAKLDEGTLIGGQILFSNNSQQYYLIQSSGAYNAANQTFTVTVAGNRNLQAEGVGIGVKAMFAGAPRQNVEFEAYVESVVSINFGGLYLDNRPFRTTPINQRQDLIFPRSQTALRYRNNPIADMKSFGVYSSWRFCRGDGNLFDFGNFKAQIVGGKLRVIVDALTITLSDTLPTSFKLFCQLSAENNRLSIYLNGIFKHSAEVRGFIGSSDWFTLTSEGSRGLLEFFVITQLLTDGKPALGEMATQDVAMLFDDNNNVIDAELISAHAPSFTTNPIAIPSASLPKARSVITATSSNPIQITVADGTNFDNSSAANPVPVWVLRRNRYPVAYLTARGKSGNNITVESVAGIIVTGDDELIQGELNDPGKASVRFPFDPIDPQEIRTIDTVGRSITVSSTTAFRETRAFVVTQNYQEIAEVKVQRIDAVATRLFLDSVEGLAVGQIIVQPDKELIIHPDNYVADALDMPPNVSFERYTSGFSIRNGNDVDIVLPIQVRVFL
jgi:hypothetical protein